MERRRRHFEGEADKQEDEAEDDADRARALNGRGDAGEIDRARKAVDQRGAIEQHAGGERAKDEIFEPGLRRPDIVAIEGGDHVKRERHQFEAKIERDEVLRSDQRQHADRGEQDEDRELEFVDALAGEEILAHDQRHHRAKQRQHLHEATEAVVDDGAVKHDRVCFGAEREDEYGGGEEADRDLGHRPVRDLAAKGAEQHERKDADCQNQLRQAMR